MKLAICIPTHHGRALMLRELLNSILRQEGVESGALEICISDNASEDGTAQIVAEFQRQTRVPIRYHRFPTDMRGVRNFNNAIEMAQAEYCWLVGSDDVVLDGGVERVVGALAAYPDVSGVTVNKLNFDRALERFVGPDASEVLPPDPGRTRPVEGAAAIIATLGLLFSYMSAHVFRRQAWKSVVAEAGIDGLLATRHFPHTFVLCQIARRDGRWLWIGEYCVAQRLGNFCLMEEKENRDSLYAMEILEDLDRVWGSVLDRQSPEYAGLMRRHFQFYWNMFCVRGFKCERGLTQEEDRKMRDLAARCFRRVPMFWLTSYPILLLPTWFLRLTRPLTSLRLKSGPLGRGDNLRGVLRALRIENKWTRQFDAAEAFARHRVAGRADQT
jgi:abequosyltransferase